MFVFHPTLYLLCWTGILLHFDFHEIFNLLSVFYSCTQHIFLYLFFGLALSFLLLLLSTVSLPYSLSVSQNGFSNFIFFCYSILLKYFYIYSSFRILSFCFSIFGCILMIVINFYSFLSRLFSFLLIL